MKKWLFNPFEYVAGGKALVIGLVCMAIAAVTGYYANTHFDGVLHMNRSMPHLLIMTISEQVVCWLCVVLTFFIAAKIFSRSAIRFIDVAGTVALARWPAIMQLILGMGLDIPKTSSPEALAQRISAVTIVCALLSVAFVVWMVTLFYNAFKVSCNIKGGKGVAIFIVSLLLADLLSRLILLQIVKFTV